MPPVAFTTPIPPWVKGAWNYFTSPHPSYYEELLQYLENRSTSDTWRHLTVKYHNTAAGATTADDCSVGYDILNITAGMPDSTWVTSDFTTVESKFDTYHASLAAYCPNWLTITEYRWYVKEFGPLGAKAFVDHGPPARVTAKSIVGTATTKMGAQTALTITERTAWARHWGRVYLPAAPSSVQMAAGGRLSATEPGGLSSIYSTLNAAIAAADFQLVVPVTQVDKAQARDLLTVSSVQVDDILDVMRSRRPRNPLVRDVRP